jgi:hypothetical protein
MCHKSGWARLWAKSGEQIWPLGEQFTGLFTALLRKMECFDRASKKKPSKINTLLGFNFF